MTTGVYIKGVIASDSKVTSGSDINPVYFKKTHALKGSIFGKNVLGACIAGDAFKTKKFFEWIESGAELARYIPHFQNGLQAIVLTDDGAYLYQNGEFLDAWDGVSIGSGGSKATAFYNASKQLGKDCTAIDAIKAAICPVSGDAFSGGMIQWLSVGNKGTTDMPNTISPDQAHEWERHLV